MAHLREDGPVAPRDAADPGVGQGRFEDGGWVERWDVAFARLYLDAYDAEVAGPPGSAVPRPWRLAFHADPGLPDLRHVLLGINAHINSTTTCRRRCWR